MGRAVVHDAAPGLVHSPARAPATPRHHDARARSWWDDAAKGLAGLPGGRGLNIAYEAVDRHAAGPDADRCALRVVSRSFRTTELTYRELSRRTNRCANVLRTLGVGKGDAVFVLTGRSTALYTAVLGTLKAGAVSSPLSSSFGPEPIVERLARGDAVALVTTESLFRRKVTPLLGELPALRHVLVTGGCGGYDDPRVSDFDAALLDASASFDIGPTAPDDIALLHFTSGTTGPPKAALHAHGAVVAHHATAALALDLHDDDVFWCTADPGWVTGTSYGIIAPLTHGATCVVDEGEFDAARWYALLERHRVTVWYTSPTALRMLMRAGDDLVKGFNVSALRFLATVGEPLGPDAVRWGERALNTPVHDTWWQTETGAIMIANDASAAVRPGSMGRPLPGVEAVVLRRGDDGRALVHDGAVTLARPDEEGELALRPGWPAMFRGYLHDPDAYAACFAGGWYLTGDVARRDADGYFWFVGRADDMIKSAGHFIGPFEVERVLSEHPAVAEAAAVGKPDPVAGEVVKAFVSLRPGHSPSEALRRELIGWGRTRLGSAVAPREIAFDDRMPHTTSGKIMRRALKVGAHGMGP
jgi:acetyl-CoA synthetase